MSRRKSHNLLHKAPVVLHACPECPMRQPRPFCQTCNGRGLLTELQLRIWNSKRMQDDNGMADVTRVELDQL
jgi:hypothetical protein